MSAFDQLPEPMKGPVAYMAYERGHSAGESEVEAIKESIASDLLPAIQQVEREAAAKQKCSEA